MKEINDNVGGTVTCDVPIMEENEGKCDRVERKREREEMMSCVEWKSGKKRDKGTLED